MKKCIECLLEKEEKCFDKTNKTSTTLRSRCRKCRNTKNKKSYFSKPGNIEKIKVYQREYQREHRKNNDYYRLYQECLSQIRASIKGRKNNSIKSHLESLFTDGMNWSNYGDYWEVDHIISATKMAKAGYSKEEINKLSNIRPMKVKENRERMKK